MRRRDPMIAIGQIIAAGILTGIAVAVASVLARWPWPSAAAAVLGSVLLIIGWRLAANALQLNQDFIPAVSVADAVCLAFGALAPIAAAITSRLAGRAGWMPAVVGGLAGFIVNVLVL
jgi:predicted tellurium resistance membrane protein TerC